VTLKYTIVLIEGIYSDINKLNAVSVATHVVDLISGTSKVGFEGKSQ
jgi:hypothetical protein